MEPSSYIKFVRKVWGSNWTHFKIRQQFFKQVNKSDYHAPEVDQLLEHLYLVSKYPPKELANTPS